MASLDNIDAKAAKAAMRAGLRAAGELVRAEVASRAPVRTMAGGNSLPEGALAADITLEVKQASTTGQQYAVVQPGRLTRHVARWVEYGHRIVRGGQLKFLANGKTRGRGGYSGENVPAHPFIRPAFEATQASVVKTFAEKFIEALKK
jgi:HK97 gp10 family phage protein